MSFVDDLQKNLVNFAQNMDKETVSQMLGYAIVAGSVSLKVPQIINIVNAGSTDGVSWATTAMEFFCFSTAFFYGQSKNMPAETYMENGIIAIQVATLLLMLMLYNRVTIGSILTLAAFGGYCYAFHTGIFAQHHFEGRPAYEYLYLSTIPFGVMSKVPQIIQFYRNASTGNASFPTWLLNFGGSVARVFTTIAQVGDPVMTGAYILNSAFGGIIVLQFLAYWGNGKKKTA
ncbi:Mannose-P-dolichol utilization defect 1 protein-like protein 1 [Diplonema papillatum]|nr:Mannose-P-dolichol utilization defect 1 protein-like protein 1 [Diplonema papillatum]